MVTARESGHRTRLTVRPRPTPGPPPAPPALSHSRMRKSPRFSAHTLSIYGTIDAVEPGVDIGDRGVEWSRGVAELNRGLPAHDPRTVAQRMQALRREQ